MVCINDLFINMYDGIFMNQEEKNLNLNSCVYEWVYIWSLYWFFFLRIYNMYKFCYSWCC